MRATPLCCERNCPRSRYCSTESAILPRLLAGGEPGTGSVDLSMSQRSPVFVAGTVRALRGQSHLFHMGFKGTKKQTQDSNNVQGINLLAGKESSLDLK